MLFDTPEYFIFISLLYFCYSAAPTHSIRKSVLLIGNYLFYISFSVPYGILLLASTVFSYVMATLIARPQVPATKKRYLWLAIGVTILPLLFFKYWNFLLANIILLLPTLPAMPRQPYLLPLGISFFTFNLLSYLIDCYKGTATASDKPLDYALYVSFFPSLLAGPLMRAKEFIPQLQTRNRIPRGMIWEGLVLISSGFLKKIVVADNLAYFVEPLFNQPSAHHGLELLLGAYAYTVQIYCDFSGYTDIARGTALFFGFNLPINFNSPYLAKNPSDFWGRWHISLSTWFRDYVYFPLGGNRRGLPRTTLNLFLVMLLCGLWHGASWHFVVWGIYHGGLLIGYRYAAHLVEKVKPRLGDLLPAPLVLRLRPLHHLLAILLCFHSVVFGWIIFKAKNLELAREYLLGILSNSAVTLPPHLFSPAGTMAALAVLAFTLYTIGNAAYNLKKMAIGNPFNPYLLSGITIIFLLVIAFHVNENVQFIYFQF